MSTNATAPPDDPTPDPQRRPSTAVEGPASARGHEAINILIVDDEPKNLTVLETILDEPEYRLFRAESADQALLALIQDEFALLILDIRMPGMTGFELAQLIKERKKTAHVPIIFLTAYYNEDQHVIEGYGTGAVDYLHKPVNPTILRSKVAVFAELHRISREVAMANRALLAEVSERRRAEERLRELNDNLERRVLDRTEALRASDRRKDEFLATLAHELRNPLAPVRNAVQVLDLKGPAIPEVKWAKEVIDRQMLAMTRLIDDLMDVSRISRGKIKLKKERVELARVVQAAIESSRPLIEKEGHELIVRFPPQSILLDGDAVRLAQVFLNLLNNAAKFSPSAGRIELVAKRLGNDVVVSVKDNGIGISAAHRESVFEMFSQVEGALSRSQGGLGIGLCLVKRLVEMHDGRVEVNSDGPGQGSEFLVRLPVLTDSSAPAEIDEGEIDRAIPPSALRVLVVDDNRDAASSLMMLLEAVGNTVYVAHDGEGAVEAADKYRPQVVLLDIGLPKMNGYDAARTIRREQWGQKMVLIAMTGWGQDEDKRKSAEAGFDRHMVKPVDPRSLITLLNEIHLPKS
ncbi:response regulator [Limnoglobus roseus]|uniref:histidine kinase n=1 Tax=Limnoglobus roseus TaxID=2598579 RepID=A0A5C1ADJ5_9BACT|nr:response regulator [Limnoglobus roseus]QEL16237.1 hybrid sensor histidine kinase/response regulator [Limnoglobus roseus]